MSIKSEVRFEGIPVRDCGEHRTTGPRAWCSECSEWCYPEIACRGCLAPSYRKLREAAKQLNGLVVPTRYREDVSRLAAAVAAVEAIGG